MTESTQCKSTYATDMRCQLKQGHKDLHKFTKFWTDGD